MDVDRQMIYEKTGGPLHIAFISWDAEQTTHWLQDLVTHNRSSVKKATRKYIEMRDGTRIIAVHPSNIPYGIYFDQIIVADDRRKLIFDSRRCSEVIFKIQERRSYRVPDDFFIQFYDLDS